jgi:hypothetical protein
MASFAPAHNRRGPPLSMAVPAPTANLNTITSTETVRDSARTPSSLPLQFTALRGRFMRTHCGGILKCSHSDIIGIGFGIEVSVDIDLTGAVSLLRSGITTLTTTTTDPALAASFERGW